MEASKCPKCGDEPHFVETVDKWYCYGCNSYIDDEVVKPYEDEVPAASHVVNANEVAQELRSLDEEHAATCNKCGADLEKIKDGKLYCYICEEYPEEGKIESKPNEVQALLDSIPSPAPVDMASASIVQPTPEPAKVEALEPVVEKQIDIKMCATCDQPLKWIEKYQRHYCYGCRKYAPRESAEKQEPAPKHEERGQKSCPGCNGELRFIEKYGEYYCFACKAYPLRAKKAAPAAEKHDACPTCGGQLKFIEKYQRHYCQSCKEYAPKGHGQAAKEKKACPTCDSEMKYVAEYNEWYCYKCKKYSLRPAKPVLLF